MSKTKRPPIPFAAVTPRIAAEMIKMFKARMAASAAPTMTIRFAGEWRGRRFTISSITESVRHVTAPVRDIENRVLLMPVVDDQDYLIAVLRGFGMAVQAAARKADPSIELVPADGVGHLVPAWHHVAACGRKGPWDDPLGPPKLCAACLSATLARM